MRFSRRRTHRLLELICLGAFIALGLEFSTGAQALPPDVGLVTQLTGDVTYWNKAYQEAPEKVQPFMKIRKGDHFRLAPGAAVQVVYFQSGRQESWKGPAAFLAGDLQSNVGSEKGTPAQPEVVILPTEASQQMRRIPILLRRARLSRSGAMQIRGGGGGLKAVVPSREERAEISMAKEAYQKWRKQARPDDITPELNLLGVLADYEQYEEMEKTLKEAFKRQPGNEVLRDLEEWVRSQKGNPEKR